MYCRHCGKELSDEAMMCPNCGTPTEYIPVRKPERATGAPQKRFCAITGFTLSVISFVATFVLLTICMCFGRSCSDIFTILPGLAGLVFCILGIYEAKKTGDALGRGFAIAGIVLAAVALFYCFIICAISYSIHY